MPQDKSYLKMSLKLKSTVLGYELDALERYIYDNTENINKLERSLLDKLAELKKKGDYQEEDIIERYEEEFMHYRDYYPDIFHKSIFLTQYSLFEVQMAELCRFLYNKDEDLMDPDLLVEKDYILRYWRWLRKDFHLNLQDLSSEYTQIQTYQQLRNKLMHGDGDIIKNADLAREEQPLYKSINDNPYLTFKNNSANFHITNNQFLIEFGQLIRKFLTEIMCRAETRL